MTTEITTTTTLEERLSKLMAENIGGLITPEDMKGYVAKGINKALFEGRTVSERWGGTRTDPCLVDRLVEEHVGKAMRAAIEQWLADNPEKIVAAMQMAIDRGVMASLSRAMDDRFGNLFYAAVNSMQSQGLLPQPGGLR